MEFCLFYQGKLKSRDGAAGKHAIRASLDRQLRSICRSQTFSHSFEPDLEGKRSANEQPMFVERMGKRFWFLISENLATKVNLSFIEILIGELFKPLLPADIGVGTGQIIDCYKSPMSPQIDIILFDKSILPPVLIDERLGLFPVESVLYTIEVKTTLNATELRAAHQSAQKISKFGYLPGLTDELGKEKNHPIERVRSVVFALSSDLTGTGMSEAERYRKLYTNEQAHLRAICVAGRGYWYDDGDQWIGAAFTNEFDEVLAFIGGVTNTYKQVSRSRHDPLLGKYIIPDMTGSAIIESRKIVRVLIRCEGCGKEAMFKPDVGKVNLVVNGALINSEPCPDCGEKMSSAEGEYRFINGELMEQNG